MEQQQIHDEDMAAGSAEGEAAAKLAKDEFHVDAKRMQAVRSESPQTN